MELDHVFILCDVGAPGAAALQRLGIREGTSNTHPGQGTACRRFFFANAYLELVWVENDAEAGAGEAKRTRLLERSTLRHGGACPFGVIVRPTGETAGRMPFPTWAYAPSYFPPGFVLGVAEDTALSEPEIFLLPQPRAAGMLHQQPLDHAVPADTVRSVTISGSVPEGLSPASRALVAAGIVRFEPAPAYTLRLDFADAPSSSADLRPELPLILSW